MSFVACTTMLLGTQLLAAAPSLAAPETHSASSEGCPTTAGGIPDGAMQAQIGDVDGDGRADTESMTNDFQYGIQTVSGATHTVSAALAGPAWHLGWTARMQDGTVLTMIDDQRDAELFTFAGCAFGPVKN